MILRVKLLITLVTPLMRATNEVIKHFSALSLAAPRNGHHAIFHMDGGSNGVYMAAEQKSGR